jgi:hypothetical protein
MEKRTVEAVSMAREVGTLRTSRDLAAFLRAVDEHAARARAEAYGALAARVTGMRTDVRGGMRA